MRNEIYFTTYLTENEHECVEHIIRNFCSAKGWEVVYYRRFKQGHQPGYRECKIKGNPRQIRQALKDEGIEIDNVNKKFFSPVTGNKVEKFVYERIQRILAK